MYQVENAARVVTQHRETPRAARRSEQRRVRPALALFAAGLAVAIVVRVLLLARGVGGQGDADIDG